MSDAVLSVTGQIIALMMAIILFTGRENLTTAPAGMHGKENHVIPLTPDPSTYKRGVGMASSCPTHPWPAYQKTFETPGPTSELYE